MVFEPPDSEEPPKPSAAFVITPLTHATATHAVYCDGSAAGENANDCPADVHGVGVDASTHPETGNAALLVARPAVALAARAFGAAARKYWNATKSRGEALNGLSYWNDNQAPISVILRRAAVEE